MKAQNRNFAQSTITSIPAWAKGVAVVAILAGVGFLIFKVNKFAKDRKANEGNKKEEDAIKNELTQANSNPATKQKLTPSQASAIANSVFTAMDGYGTDGSGIYTKLTQIQNNADWLAVRASYGIREVSSGKFNPEPNFKGTLEGALASELGVNDWAWVNKINAYFKSKGVNAKI